MSALVPGVRERGGRCDNAGGDARTGEGQGRKVETFVVVAFGGRGLSDGWGPARPTVGSGNLETRGGPGGGEVSGRTETRKSFISGSSR